MQKVSIRLTDEQYNFINDFRQVLTSQMGSKVGFSEALRFIIHRNQSSVANPSNAVTKLARLSNQQLQTLSDIYTKLNAFVNDDSLKNYENTVSSNLNQIAYAFNTNQMPSDLSSQLSEIQQTHTGVKQNLTSIKKELDDLNQVLRMISMYKKAEATYSVPDVPNQSVQEGVNDASDSQH